MSFSAVHTRQQVRVGLGQKRYGLCSLFIVSVILVIHTIYLFQAACIQLVSTKPPKIKALASLLHLRNDRLCPIIGVSSDGHGKPVVVTERCMLCPLAQVIDSGSSPQVKLFVAMQVCEAMELLNSKGYIHGCLSPDCVLLWGFDPKEVYDVNVKVCHYFFEWTIDCIPPELEPRLAPEVRRQRRFTSESDVWATGILLWQLFDDGIIPDLDMITNSMPRHATEPLSLLIKQCLRLDPAHRTGFKSLQHRLCQQFDLALFVI